MTKQEEVKEEVAKITSRYCSQIMEKKWVTVELTKFIFNYLHSQRCRIEVKCPDCEWSQFKDGESVGMTPCHNCNSTGYRIEPLIKEVGKDVETR